MKSPVPKSFGFCPVCGTRLEDRDRFCGGCGNTALNKRPSTIRPLPIGMILVFAIALAVIGGFTWTRLDRAPLPAVPLVSPSGSERIAFISDRDGTEGIYAMDPDGSNVTMLANSPVDGATPMWSPDGTRIAFTSVQDETFEIYVMDADGSNLIRLTDHQALGGPMPFVDMGRRVLGRFATQESVDALNDRHGRLQAFVAWSPDGTRIAFASNRDGRSDIYVADVDGSNVTKLTDHPANDWEPVWSPDGTRIAFSSDREGRFDVYVMDADGSNVTRLTDHAPVAVGLIWSPDGARIFYTSLSHLRAFVTDTEGSNVVEFPMSSTSPARSPDSTRIAFASDQGIHVLDADGSNVTNLTDHPGNDWEPVWSPDGTRIAFSSDREGHFEIYVMDADGSNVTRLTNHPADDKSPAWFR